MDAPTQTFDYNKTISQFGVEWISFGVEMNVKHSHTHNNNHRLQMLTKGVNSQVDYQNHNALGLPKVSPLQA